MVYFPIDIHTDEHSTIVAYLDLGQLVFEATIDPNNLLDQEVGDALRRMINGQKCFYSSQKLAHVQDGQLSDCPSHHRTCH